MCENPDVTDPATIQLTELLTTWYGTPSRDAAPSPPSSAWLPAALKEWHSLASQRDIHLTYTTSMIPPDSIRPTEDGKAVFMVDATADWRWSFDINDPDIVYDAEYHAPWSRNSERLSEFLVHNTIRELIFGAAVRLTAFTVSNQALAEVLRPLDEVEFGHWDWPAPGYRTFMEAGTIAEIVEPEAGSGWQVSVGMTRPDLLPRIPQI